MWLVLLGAVGATLIVTMSRIAAPVRAAFSRLYSHLFPSSKHCPIHCSQCTGVWVGWAAGLAYCLVQNVSAPIVLEATMLGPACSVVAYLVHITINKLDPE